MHMQTNRKKTLFGALALVVVTGAASVSAKESGTYLGGGLGLTDYQNAKKSDFGPGGRVGDDDDLGWRLFGGYRADNLAVETGYNNFGDLKGRNAAGNVKADAWGLDLTGMAFVPVSNVFEVFGRAGTYYWNSDVERSGANAARLKDKTDWNLTYGVGGQLKTTSDLSVRGEWRQFRDLYGKVNTNVWMASLVSQF